MKKSYILIALAMVAALSTVSCKCSSKKSQEPTREEVQEMKQALADSVLAEIDACAEKLSDANSKSFKFQTMELTDNEKQVKPDYLLDPSVANTLVTKTQKVNALAIYCIELGVRMIYDMPQDETKEAIAKLAVEVNHPDAEFLMNDTPISEKIKREYEVCKERGDLTYFWQYCNAIHFETSYIIAQNPELYLGKISDDQWQAFAKEKTNRFKAIDELSKYDEEMSVIKHFKDSNIVFASKEEAKTVSNSREEAIRYHNNNKDKYIARRNALLQ